MLHDVSYAENCKENLVLSLDQAQKMFKKF